MATRVDLINDIAETLNIPKAAAAQSLEAVVSAISGRLAKKETVILRGFGAFSVRTAAARVGRNPQDGSQIQIAAKEKISFKPSKA